MVVVDPAAVVVVAPATVVVVVVAVRASVVVVAAPATVVVVEVVDVVVVVVSAAGTVQVSADGTSFASAATTICTFQYLSNWVAEETPLVHAKPRLYLPAGRNVVPPVSTHANDSTGRPMSSPVLTAVVLFTHDEPALVNSG